MGAAMSGHDGCEICAERERRSAGERVPAHRLSWWEDDAIDDDGEPNGIAHRWPDAATGDEDPAPQASVWPIFARGARVVAFGWSVQLPGGGDGPDGRVDVEHPQGWPWDAWRAARRAADDAARAAGWTLAPRGTFEAD